MRIARPLEKNYAITLAIAILAIAPYIFVTTGYELFGKELHYAIGVTKTGLSIIDELSIAAYAFGALLGGDVIQRFPQRKLFFICESVIAPDASSPLPPAARFNSEPATCSPDWERA